MKRKSPRNTKKKAETSDISPICSPGNIKTEDIQVY